MAWKLPVVIVKFFLANGGVLEISHQFYSLDLPSAEFFLFSKEKTAPERRLFSTPKTSRAGFFLFCFCGMGRELGFCACIRSWTSYIFLVFSQVLFLRRLEIFQQKVYSCSAYPPSLPILKYPDNDMVPVPNTSTFLFHSMHLFSHGPASYI